MTDYYEQKMKFFFLQWQTAVDTDKPIAAAQHMQNYLNYKQMFDMRERLQQA